MAFPAIKFDDSLDSGHDFLWAHIEINIHIQGLSTDLEWNVNDLPVEAGKWYALADINYYQW